MTARTIFIIFLISTSYFCNAQGNWLRKAGGNNLDEALDISHSISDNSYCVTGYFSGISNFGVGSLVSNGSSDVFLAKYDVAGIPLWARKFGGLSTDRSLAVTNDNDGNTYICGFYSGQANFGIVTLNAVDSNDVFVAKINLQGDVVWAKSAGGSGNDAAVGIAIDANASVIITGRFRGSANFGLLNLVSANSEGGVGPSADIFIAKLDNNGNWIWARKGSTINDENPTDVCVDGQNNIYISGQFSGDITFDLTHTNDLENVGYVVKYSASGQEMWFSKIAATQISPNALRCDSENNVLITGESIGQIIFFATNNEVVATANIQSIFLAKYSSAGAVIWAMEDGSDSYCSAKTICIGANNEAYIAGTFECVFSEYADELGEGLFNSAGFRDVFVTRYSGTGNREWTRQYGGPRSEFCSAIANGENADEPRLAGSFEKYFNVPGDLNSFTSNTSNFIPSFSDNLTNPNSGALCGDPNYGGFIHIKAQANKDIFIGNFVNLTLPHYDFYSRGDCNFPIEEPCINDTNEPLVCNQSITNCGSALVQINFNTGSNCWIGPEYNWQWSDGSQANTFEIVSTGWVSIEVEREDGCASYSDSIFVEILEQPIPTISDDEGINIESPPDAMEIMLCAPDEVLLTGGDESEESFYWTDANGIQIENNPITAIESGDYTFTVVGENGCTGENKVQVIFLDPLEEIDPLLQFNEMDQPINDTLIICGNDFITTELIDQLEQDDFALFTDAIWQIAIDTGYYPPYDGFESYSWSPLQSGWHFITATPFLSTPAPCPVDTIWYPSQEISVFIVLLDDPHPNPQIAGGQPWCPGDVILLTATGANSYTWSGPGIVQYIGVDSILVNLPGTYLVSSYEEFENGCSTTNSDGLVISAIPQPQIASDPEHGIICPGSTILLSAQTGTTYQWLGPFGQNLGSEQSISVSQPGNYLCEITLNGCTLESNVIEVSVYTTPYILALPSADLCTNNVVTLIVQAYPDAVIEWQPPLSGSASFMDVYEPNTYSVIVEFCNIQSEVELVVTETNPTPTIVASNDILCPGGSITLSTNSDMENYHWFPSGQQTQSIVVTQPGAYYVEIADTNQCEAVSNEFVIALYNMTTPIAQDQGACYGQTISLSATGQNVFWAANFEGTDVLSEENVFITPPVFDTLVYYVFAQDANCTSLPNEVSVTIFPSSQLYIESMDSTYCAGESFVITSQEIASQGLQYNWILPNGSTNNNFEIEVNISTIENNGWYFLNALDIHCESPPDSIFITVENPSNQALIAEDTLKVCVASELMVTAEIDAGQYNWNTPLGNFNEPTIIIEEVNFNAEGNYTLVVPGVHCPTNADTVLVDVVAYPEFELNDSIVYCDGGYLIAHLPLGFDSYLWSNGATYHQTILPLNGFLSVEVINFPSCSKRDSIQLSSIDCLNEFPNIFTPNGDGDNEYVDFGWLRIPIDEVKIFNRWGILIKALNDHPFVWNGRTDAGELVSDGVYYYVAKSPNAGRHSHNLSGYIHVLGKEGGTH